MPTIACPGCGKVGVVPDEAMSLNIRCPACDRRFVPDRAAETVEHPRPLPAPWVPPPPPVPARVDPEVVRAVRLPDPVPTPAPPARRLCPFCAEPIMMEAKVCKHCREVLDPVLRAAEEARRHAEARPPTPAPAPVHHSTPIHVVQSVVVRGQARQYGCGTLLFLLFLLFVVFAVIGSLSR